ncbi:hypothetical protein HHI36_002482 [Cryptolaemus montrouzieri]|uniref:Uncharacterized protein n=1 Tax=Cryptolaemus montrouzieri TaxID=559131 RepID=A0ABD2PAY2_9CUCU
MDFSPYGSDFLNEIRSSLENHNVAHAVAIINDNRYFENLKNNCWDLVPVITKYLSSDYENDKLEVFKGCEELLNKIAENSNPEEALLQFIEEIEESEDDTKFVTILFPMLKVLQRIPKNRLNSLAWCLNAIQTYLNKIETSGNEKMVFRTELLYHDVLRFYDILIPYYSVKLNSSTNKNFPLVICKYLIELLGRPLGFLNLTFVEIKSRIRKIAENIVEKVLLVCADPFIYLEMEKVIS